MNTIRQIAVLIMFTLGSQVAQAGSGAIDFLRSTGKIYSVVAVILVIFLGMIFYLYRLDCKISKLEKHIRNEKE